MPRVDKPSSERLAQIKGMVPNPFFRADRLLLSPRCPKSIQGGLRRDGQPEADAARRAAGLSAACNTIPSTPTAGAWTRW